MTSFSGHLTPLRSWRLAVLMGRNTRTYKFALANALLEAARSQEDVFPIEVLAIPYVRALLDRPSDAKQRTGSGELGEGDFLRILEEERVDSVRLGNPTSRIVESAVKSMPAMVMQKFHNLHGGNHVGHDFYEVISRRGSVKVRITPELRSLVTQEAAQTLEAELESRWVIVERAWDAGIGPGLVATGPVLDASGDMLLDPVRRAAVTKSRDSLVGFQAGRCFYCETPIPKDFSNTHVDHVFPFALMSRGIVRHLDLNAVWNLVVACQACNLSKSSDLPDELVVSRLFERNEAIVGSPYPLKRAIEFLTGMTVEDRATFLRSVLAELG
jgi:hypothetical protein